MKNEKWDKVHQIGAKYQKNIFLYNIKQKYIALFAGLCIIINM